MSKLATVTAAQIELFGFRFRPLTLADYGRLDNWMADAIQCGAIEAALKMRLDQRSVAVLNAWAEAAVRVAATTSTSTPAGMAQINTYAGMVKVLEIASDGKCTEAALTAALPDGMDLEQAVTLIGQRVFAAALGERPPGPPAQEGAGEAQPDPQPPGP